MKRQSKLLIYGGIIIAGALSGLNKLRGSSNKQLRKLKMKLKDEATVITETRGKIYFELFTAYRHFGNIKAGIYNTTKRIPVPLDDWNNLDTDLLKKELGAAAIIKNGPRFWMMDELHGYYSGEPMEFSGYTYDLVAILTRKYSELSNRENYTEQTINRYTDFIFKKGKKIYELTSDAGIVYTLQAASMEILKDQSPDSLDTLQDKLKLPDGWKFSSRILNEDISFKIRGEAHVIQDEFRNTYQRNPV